jgi:hypothetical protein
VSAFVITMTILLLIGVGAYIKDEEWGPAIFQGAIAAWGIYLLVTV